MKPCTETICERAVQYIAESNARNKRIIHEIPKQIYIQIKVKAEAADLVKMVVEQI